MPNEKAKDKKPKNEKPISLHPVPFEDALREILKVKPKKKGKQDDSEGE
jgi:hypothetical protein